MAKSFREMVEGGDSGRKARVNEADGKKESLRRRLAERFAKRGKPAARRSESADAPGMVPCSVEVLPGTGGAWEVTFDDGRSILFQSDWDQIAFAHDCGLLPAGDPSDKSSWTPEAEQAWVDLDPSDITSCPDDYLDMAGEAETDEPEEPRGGTPAKGGDVWSKKLAGVPDPLYIVKTMSGGDVPETTRGVFKDKDAAFNLKRKLAGKYRGEEPKVFIARGDSRALYLKALDMAGASGLPLDTDLYESKANGRKVAENEEGDEAEPQDEDYMLAPTGTLGSKTSVSVVGGKYLGTFSSDEEAVKFIRARMKKENFYPNIWVSSDHGNVSLYTESKGGKGRKVSEDIGRSFFYAMASHIKSMPSGGITKTDVGHMIGEMMADQNPRFDFGRFYQAAGLPVGDDGRLTGPSAYDSRGMGENAGEEDVHYELADFLTKQDYDRLGMKPVPPGTRLPVRAVASGETREPEAGEWYLDGRRAYRTRSRLARELPIARLVKAQGESKIGEGFGRKEPGMRLGWKIMAQMSGQPAEEVDSTTDTENANYLVGEYRTAYGAGWSVWKKRGWVEPDGEPTAENVPVREALSRKDFIAWANFIKGLPETMTKVRLINELTKFLATQNPRFDARRFEKACGEAAKPSPKTMVEAKLTAPVIITPRLMAGVRIGKGYVSIEYAEEDGPGRYGRTTYHYAIDTDDGFEHEGTDLRSGHGGGNLQDGLASLLSFLSAAAESANPSRDHGENYDIFPPEVSDWAYQYSDEISSLQMEIEEAEPMSLIREGNAAAAPISFRQAVEEMVAGKPSGGMGESEDKSHSTFRDAWKHLEGQGFKVDGKEQRDPTGDTHKFKHADGRTALLKKPRHGQVTTHIVGGKSESAAKGEKVVIRWAGKDSRPSKFLKRDGTWTTKSKDAATFTPDAAEEFAAKHGIKAYGLFPKGKVFKNDESVTEGEVAGKVRDKVKPADFKDAKDVDAVVAALKATAEAEKLTPNDADMGELKTLAQELFNKRNESRRPKNESRRRVNEIAAGGQAEYDVEVIPTGSVVLFTLMTTDAVEWVQANAYVEGWQWMGKNTFAVDTRVAGDLIQGMEDDGLSVDYAQDESAAQPRAIARMAASVEEQMGGELGVREKWPILEGISRIEHIRELLPHVDDEILRLVAATIDNRVKSI